MEQSSGFGRNENAALNSRTFAEYAGRKFARRMTIQGAVNRAAMLLGIVAITAAVSWITYGQVNALGELAAWQALAALVAFVFGLAICLRRELAPMLAPVYAALEGVFLGGISAISEALYPGLVLPAVMLTLATLGGLLLVYRSSGYRVTAKFRAGIIAATFSIVVVYLISLVLNVVAGTGLPLLHESGWIGIGFNLFVVAIAALNLVLDFDLIETGAREGAPAYMEWYAAFGVLVTLVWLYLEVLRLLAQLAASGDDD